MGLRGAIYDFFGWDAIKVEKGATVGRRLKINGLTIFIYTDLGCGGIIKQGTYKKFNTKRVRINEVYDLRMGQKLVR